MTGWGTGLDGAGMLTCFGAMAMCVCWGSGIGTMRWTGRGARTRWESEPPAWCGLGAYVECGASGVAGLGSFAALIGLGSSVTTMGVDEGICLNRIDVYGSQKRARRSRSTPWIATDASRHSPRVRGRFGKTMSCYQYVQSGRLVRRGT